jgi:hypothetical protein
LIVSCIRPHRGEPFLRGDPTASSIWLPVAKRIRFQALWPPWPKRWEQPQGPARQLRGSDEDRSRSRRRARPSTPGSRAIRQPINAGCRGGPKVMGADNSDIGAFELRSRLEQRDCRGPRAAGRRQ